MSTPMTNVRYGLGCPPVPVDDELVCLRAREHLLALDGLVSVWGALDAGHQQDVWRVNHALGSALQRAWWLRHETEKQIDDAASTDRSRGKRGAAS